MSESLLDDGSVRPCSLCGRAPLLNRYKNRLVIFCYQASHKVAVEGFPMAAAVDLWNDTMAAKPPAGTTYEILK